MSVTINGTTGITSPGGDVSTSLATGALTVAGNNISAVGGFQRNRIINGAMGIWQRGTTTGSVAGSSAPYMVDRFYGYAGSGNITISQSSDVPTGFQYSCSMLGTGVSITQRIESKNCVDLGGSTVTVSFWAKSTAGSDNLTVSLYTATGGVDNYSSQTATTNTVSASPSGSWTYYTTTFVGIPSTATNGVGIGLGRGSGGSSTTLITGVQLEAGSVATPFEFRQYGQELALCQRYYQRITALNSYQYISNWGSNASGTVFRTTFPLKTAIRAAVTSVDFSNLVVDDNGTVPGVTALIVYGSNTFDQVGLQATVSSGLTTFRPAVLASGVGTGFVGISAEL